MKSRKIQQKDIELILETDRRLYPTSSPVTREIINEWYVKNPEFGMIFEKNSKLAGSLVVIPLNKMGWNGLVSGKLKEADLNEKYIFDNFRDKEIGLHGYHIEKFDKNIKDFSKYAFDKLMKIITDLKNRNNGLEVIGFSGLAVTLDGIVLAERILKLKERDFVLDEHILEKEGDRFVAESLKEAEAKKKEGYNYLNRCKMLSVYPNEKSLVWDCLNKKMNETKIHTERKQIIDGLRDFVFTSKPISDSLRSQAIYLYKEILMKHNPFNEAQVSAHNSHVPHALYEQAKNFRQENGHYLADAK